MIKINMSSDQNNIEIESLNFNIFLSIDAKTLFS